MPKFKITDPETGKSLVVSGEGPPTDEEASELFAQVGKTAAPKSSPVADAEKVAGFGAKGLSDSALEMVGAVPDAVAWGFRKAGLPAPKESDFYTQGLKSGFNALGQALAAPVRALGVPDTKLPDHPETNAQKLAYGAGRGVGDAASIMLPAAGIARTAKAGSLTGNVAKAMAAQPAAQIAAGAAGGGVGEATDSPALGILAALGTAGGAEVLRSNAGKLFRPDLRTISDASPKVARDAANYVEKIVLSGGKSHADLAAASASGKPIIAAQAAGRPGVSALAALGRRSGATPDALEGVLTEQMTGAPDRMLGDFSRILGVDPSVARGSIDEFVRAGREAAEPLYRKANEGGSIAPILPKLEDSFADAVTAERNASSAVRDAEQQITLSKSKQATTENVYAQNSALASEREANSQLELAQQAHDQAIAAKDAALTRLRTAQDQQANGVKGAIWSPRLQQFLDDPVMKKGLARGIEIQRLEALAAGKKFDPTEIAITGLDDAGDPIISGVPNMRTLDTAKRGLDEMLNDFRDQTTKRMVWNQRSKAIDGVRRAYLKEIDSMNPDYKTARGKAGDYLSAQSAFDTGGKAITNGNMTAKKFAETFNALSPAEQESWKGGIANQMFDMAQRGTLTPSKLKAPIFWAKLKVAFGTDGAENLKASVAQESQMQKTSARMMPGTGSATAELTENMGEQNSGINFRNFAKAADALGAGVQMAHGSFLPALARLGRVAGDVMQNPRVMTMPVETRDEAGRLLMMRPDELGQYLTNVSAATKDALPSVLQKPVVTKDMIAALLMGRGKDAALSPAR